MAEIAGIGRRIASLTVASATLSLMLAWNALAAGQPAPASEQAGAIREILAKYGLLGRQARDCHMPPGRDNVYVTYYVTDDTVRQGLIVDVSHHIFSSSRVISVEEIAPRILRFKQESRSGAFVTFDLHIDGQRVRSFESTLSTGEVLIRDGKLLAQGHDTDWMTKCE